MSRTDTGPGAGADLGFATLSCVSTIAGDVVSAHNDLIADVHSAAECWLRLTATNAVLLHTTPLATDSATSARPTSARV